MLLHFGSVPVLIVSSADSACEIMKTHDTIFASRPPYKVFDKVAYGFKSVGTAPYGEYWRKMKSIFLLHLLSNKRVQSFRYIREEETAVFVKKIAESSGLGDRPSAGGIVSLRVGRMMLDLMEILGIINIGEFIPWLGWIGRFNGYNKRLDRIAREMDQVLERVIQERLDDSQNKQIGENILDILLDIYAGDASIGRDSLKALILASRNKLIETTITIYFGLEWTMSELLLHPSVMEKLQREVRGMVKPKHSINIEKMHYLKAVIKEALRCHPLACA